VLVVDPGNADDVIAKLAAAGERAFMIGALKPA
jgi:hypothetical protein